MTNLMNDPYKAPEAELIEENHSTQTATLASRSQRFWASIIDSTLMMVPVGISLYFFSFSSISNLDEIQTQLSITLIGIVSFMVINGYLIYNYGQTVGKKICKTKVLTDDGVQISGNHYVVKRLLPIWIASQIPFIGQFVSLLDSVLIFRKSKKCLHDDIAGTIVVQA